MAHVVGLGSVEVVLFFISGVFSPVSAALQGGELLEDGLVVLLLFKGSVLEDLLVLASVSGVDLLQLLWHAESSVEHALVVADESHFPGEGFVPMILALRVDVVLLLVRCGVRLVSVGHIVNFGVASQIIVEGSLVVGWLVDQVKTARAIRDVSVSSSSVSIAVFTEPLPRIAILQFVSFSILRCVFPRGPISRPIKL